MRRIVSWMLVLVVVVAVCGCGASKGPSGIYDIIFIHDDGSEINATEFGMAYYVFEKGGVSHIDADGAKKGVVTLDGTTVQIAYEDGASDTFQFNAEENYLYIEGLENMMVLRHRD